MYHCQAGNYRDTLRSCLTELMKDGSSVSPRNLLTRELEDVTLAISNPRDRTPSLPGRNANIFALLAETIWVIAGRADLEFMKYYLPRLPQFSDDGTTLSGAYGPRIRSWSGVDQLTSVYETLRADPASRRAVISLFDPSRDHEQARKDIPCNNWLQFTIRNNRLNLRVTSRSMDVIWGSAINIFEWTILQELLAHWLQVDVGQYTHFIGSLHIYSDFYQRATTILSHPIAPAIDNFIAVDIERSILDQELATFFALEAQCRHDPYCFPQALSDLRSRWLSYAFELLRIFILASRVSDFRTAHNRLLTLADSDLKSMAFDFLIRMKSSDGNA